MILPLTYQPGLGPLGCKAVCSYFLASHATHLRMEVLDSCVFGCSVVWGVPSLMEDKGTLPYLWFLPSKSLHQSRGQKEGRPWSGSPVWRSRNNNSLYLEGLSLGSNSSHWDLTAVSVLAQLKYDSICWRVTVRVVLAVVGGVCVCVFVVVCVVVVVVCER